MREYGTLVSNYSPTEGVFATVSEFLCIYIQHGPQHNYVSHMLDQEKGQPIILAVADASFPLAMNDRGQWSDIENSEQLQGFYENKGMTIKEAWQPEA